MSVVLNAIALRYDGAHEANALERANATSPIRRTSNTRTLPPMSSAFTPERLHALAASLRLWALALWAWLAETFDHRDWRAAVARDLAEAERGTKAIIVLLALRRVVWAPDRPRGGHRPGHAPKGFALRAVRTNDMRRLTRRLLPKTRGPRSRDLVARARAAPRARRPRRPRRPPRAQTRPHGAGHPARAGCAAGVIVRAADQRRHRARRHVVSALS